MPYNIFIGRVWRRQEWGYGKVTFNELDYVFNKDWVLKGNLREAILGDRSLDDSVVEDNGSA